MDVNKSSYHPQMVDHFKQNDNKPGFFGSRNINHEFSDEDSNDEEMDPLPQEEDGFMAIKNIGNKIGAIGGKAEFEDEDRPPTPVDQSGDKLQRYAKFKNYQTVFDNLTKYQKVPTKFDIVSMIITYDSTHTLAVTKKDDTQYMLRFFNLETYKNEFSEAVGGSD